jgi:NAD+ kinase
MNIRLALIGKNQDNVKALQKRIQQAGFKIDQKRPEIVISFGGDGTYLYSERKYPGVPKLMIRDVEICEGSHFKKLNKVMHLLKQKKYTIKKHMKLEARVRRRGKTIQALECANDFIIRNKELMEAMRFTLFVGEKQKNGEIIGDGVVVCTPFGSTAYFCAITRKSFRKGMGIAFNNPTQKLAPIITKKKTITMKITRKDAELACDNDPQILQLEEGDEIFIQKSKNTANMVKMYLGVKEWIKDLQHQGRRLSLK